MASAAPTWRDASVALWLWSGVYLIFQSLISFGCGGYFAGRVRPPYASATVDIETRDGLHGVAAWALAVLIGAVLTALIAGAANRPSATTQPPPATEPSVLSYELDHLFRAPRRPPNVDLTSERAEAARILATASSHSGVLAEDRAYLVQQVTALTGPAVPDAERRVDTTLANAKSAIPRARAASIIIAFSAALGRKNVFTQSRPKADTPFLGSSRDPKRARVKIKAVRRAVHSVATRQWLENACGLFRARSLSLAWSTKQRSPCYYLITLEDT
ncbi:hypothetical protein [Bradyrhizobium barranii]|uniref:hypothetical protein n=1 Tax=Bradyrhizobium barranii TaxID=2992140 RepID=UPI003CCADD39